MRNEVKVGILAVIAVATAFWGYKYIQGKNLLSGSNSYFAYYEDISSLTVGSPLKISGVNIGAVTGIELDQQTRKVKVSMEVNQGFYIPPNTTAYIGPDGLLGGTKIDIIYDQPCGVNGEGCLPAGSEINAGVRDMISAFLNSDPESPLDPVMGPLDTVTGRLNEEFFGENSNHPIARASQDLAKLMENLNAATLQLQNLMATNSRELNRTMSNLGDLSGSLASRQEALAGIIDNTEELTENLSKIELDETLTQANSSLATLQSTLDEATKSMKGLSNIMTGLSSGEGTLGKLLQDEGIYDRLYNVSLAADSLFSDLQDRPYRYIPFKSRRRVLKFDRKDEAARVNKK